MNDNKYVLYRRYIVVAPPEIHDDARFEFPAHVHSMNKKIHFQMHA